MWDLHSKLVWLPPKRKAGSSYNPSEQQVRGREMRYQSHTQDPLRVMKSTDAVGEQQGCNMFKLPHKQFKYNSQEFKMFMVHLTISSLSECRVISATGAESKS